MLQQSAAACVPNLGTFWQENPIYQTMPAPYIWWEPSLPQYWRMTTDQDGSLYSLGTLQPAIMGTNPYYPVRRSAWTPPGGGAAQYMVDDGTLSVDSSEQGLEVIPASDYSSTGVSIVAMIKSEADPSPGTVTAQVGLGGVGFGFAGLGGGNDYIVPGIYQSSGLAYSHSIKGGQPENTNFRCYIATFVSVSILGTLFTHIDLYSNGTLVSSGDLGYSMESWASGKNLRIAALNRFYFGSMLRFDYIVNQTQVNTITNYMRTIWGTLT